jgi:hypothetical protein
MEETGHSGLTLPSFSVHLGDVFQIDQFLEFDCPTFRFERFWLHPK